MVKTVITFDAYDDGLTSEDSDRILDLLLEMGESIKIFDENKDGNRYPEYFS